MRKFAISDIHGSHYEMMKLFDYVKLDLSSDELIVLGDMIDRGPDSGNVLKQVFDLDKQYKNVKVTIGNHEEMMLWYIDGIKDLWMYHGGKEVALSINETFKDVGVSRIINWVRNLPLVYEDDYFVFSHAGITIPYGIVEQERAILWHEKDDFYEITPGALFYYTNNKPIVHGHIPDDFVTFDGCRLSIDLGAKGREDGKLALVELFEQVYYAYDFNTKKILKYKIKTVK